MKKPYASPTPLYSSRVPHGRTTTTTTTTTTVLSRSEFLTRQEVLKRRSRRLAKEYRDHYWSMMENVKIKFREYYWEYGRISFLEKSRFYMLTSARRYCNFEGAINTV